MNRTGPHRRPLPHALGCLALALACCATAFAAEVDGKRIIQADQEPGNWMSHGRTYDEQRFSPLKAINQDNVNQLGLAWSYKLDLDRGVEATPIVVDGVMYTTGPFSVVYALDARNGKLLWKYDPQSDRNRAGEACCDAVNRGVAVWQGKVYVGVLDGRLEAIDAKTGQRVWSVDTRDDHKRSYTITGAPRVVNGKVIIGNGGAEFGVRGYVTAYDAETGKQAWRFFTVPGDPKLPPEDKAMEIASKTWHGDAFVEWGGGGTAWDSFAYDPELNLLYIGVGNGSMWDPKWRSQAKGDNLFLSSIVAVNADTGEYAWHYQTTPGDAWDFTATQHMILAELPINGKQRKVLMQAPKNGFFYVLDRATGELLSAKNIVPVNWAKGIDMKTGRPILDDEAAAYWKDGKRKLVTPAFWGAHDWHPMSYNPNTGLVYIPAHIMSAYYEHIPEAPKRNPFKSVYQLGLRTGMMPEGADGLLEMAKTWSGKLIAWDPVKQAPAWEVPYITIFNGGTLSTAGNLVFEGSADGRVIAYAADTGKKLWESPAASGVMAAPITYSVDGEQYVTFMAGWGGAFSTFAGALSLRAGVQPFSQVLTYKIGGTAKLREPAPPANAPEPPPLTADAQTVAAGAALYDGNCSQCHGIHAVSGGVLPDLRKLGADKHQMFLGILYGGRVPDGMPSFADNLNPEQVEQVHQYLIKRAHDLKSEGNAWQQFSAKPAAQPSLADNPSQE
ncbi:PQQ-dependent dehydrogenase, methanol/ethanol family [Pseudomonas kermanshahensis]|uniref:PQQ-dependent dehydrogenase, methanol/ethanol family n=1 Tax=Pseudomonas kermanshahensis TaxID=2745482 RepID=A0ABU8R0S9_9PSED|nr:MULTISPECIES: PQQ-dependent dehydrogenase, methanol/ethanol family [Pseudomonas]MBC3487639.1 PQQ-dependent dehydrogenase, methanol/ethanol family [Pseudomonas sp. SWRI50]MBC3495870.1 PQQ-dependent dehydrogenase, methanol/ethanol family [Pseudomonas sp. SWRI67]MBV4526978.1 PQQ-dependent dehydrogenase, methanol/ethanol family [Pseudomonas kermanshahensis]